MYEVDEFQFTNEKFTNFEVDSPTSYVISPTGGTYSTDKSRVLKFSNIIGHRSIGLTDFVRLYCKASECKPGQGACD